MIKCRMIGSATNAVPARSEKLTKVIGGGGRGTRDGGRGKALGR
jgi:hypothetical protein